MKLILSSAMVISYDLWMNKEPLRLMTTQQPDRFMNGLDCPYENA